MYQHVHSCQLCWRHFNDHSMPEVQSNSKFIKHYVFIKRLHLDPIGSIIPSDEEHFCFLPRWRIFLNIRENSVFLSQLVLISSSWILFNFSGNILKYSENFCITDSIWQNCAWLLCQKFRNFEFFNTALTEDTF